MFNGRLPSLSEAARLLGGEVSGDQILCPGPGHSPKDRSLSVRFGSDLPDGFLTHSFAEKRTPLSVARLRDHVREKLGLPAWQPSGRKVLSQSKHQSKPKREIAAVYPYVDDHGELLFEVVRYKPKKFVQRQPDGKGGYVYKVKGIRVVVYRLPTLLEAIANDRIVFVFEGEKDVDAADSKLGVVGTCNAGGAGNWKPEHAEFLRDAKVVIVPDNDEAGRQHADDVGASLVGVAKSVGVLTLPGQAPKADISDWIERGGTAEQFWALVEQAPVWTKRLEADAPMPTTASDEAWTESVNTADVLKGIADTLDAYSILPEHGSTAIALWLLFAHALDAFWIAPLLSIESPERRCGKSKLLDLIELLAPRGYMSGNMSVATTFRVCDERKPTFVWDEVKRFITPDKVELIGLLETGYRRRSAWVDRCETEGKKVTTRRFTTWCPKVVAMKGTIGDIAETLEDRAIRIGMRRKLTSEHPLELRQDRIEPFAILRRQAERWATDNMSALSQADPAVPDKLHDRARDNWRPLLAIADLAGGEWPGLARKAAVAISGPSDEEESGGVLLLQHCKEIFDREGREWLTPSDLVRHLCADDEWPWATWRHGRDPITPRGIAKMLGGFKIKSDRGHHRSYAKSSFQEAWKRYL